MWSSTSFYKAKINHKETKYAGGENDINQVWV